MHRKKKWNVVAVIELCDLRLGDVCISHRSFFVGTVSDNFDVAEVNHSRRISCIIFDSRNTWSRT